MSNAINLKAKKAILTVAVSSRALFHLESENEIYEKDGEAAFNAYMLEHQHETLEKGVAFNLVNKLLGLNREGQPLAVEVVMLSRNSPLAGLRVMHSVREHGLDIEKAVFCRGTDRFRYARAMGADLFLSANPFDVVSAINNGVASATMLPKRGETSQNKRVVIAFDGDSCIFDGCADAMFRDVGLEKWRTHEHENASIPLGDGPFKRVIEKLHDIKQGLGTEGDMVRLGLVTARGAPAHERALRTLMNWGIDIDEAIFAAGGDKGPLLEALSADFFFDDSQRNIDSGNEFNIPSGHVPFTGEKIAA